MKKKIIYISLILLLIGVIVAIMRLNKTNNKKATSYKTELLKKRNIINKVIATGSVIPLEEVVIKPQISGIIRKIYTKEGQLIKKGDIIASISIVPNEQALTSILGKIKNIKVELANIETVYNRNKTLLNQGVISKVSFEQASLNYNRTKQQLVNAENDYQIIKQGSIRGRGTNTNIRATISGTVLQIPIEEGNQVIQSNNFNAGTTIASIADMSKMIFKGKVDESEVGKLKIGMPLEVSIGALENQKLNANLNFIAPKGIEKNGTIEFSIKGHLDIKNITQMVRAGFSANASIIIEQKDSVLSIREALLQYDKKTQKPFVEVLKSLDDETYERIDIETGISDGNNVEVISGLSKSDKIKIWNVEEDSIEK